MPPGEIDPSRLPGVLPPTRKLRVEDMSSDEEQVDSFMAAGRKKPKGKQVGEAAQVAKGKPARGEGRASGAPKSKPSKAPGQGAAPAAVAREQPPKMPILVVHSGRSGHRTTSLLTAEKVRTRGNR